MKAARIWMGRLWKGQIRGSGIASAVFIAVAAGTWLWIRWAGMAVPESMTAFLIWVYTLMAAVVIAALLAGVAVRILFLRLTLAAARPGPSDRDRRQ